MKQVVNCSKDDVFGSLNLIWSRSGGKSRWNALIERHFKQEYWAMMYLILGLVIFMIFHLIPTMTGVKARLQGLLGTMGYRVFFSLGSLAGFALIIWGYGEARADAPQIWVPPHWMSHVTVLFMVPVFPLLLASGLPGQLKQKIPHPMLMAIKIWALAHLLVNGDGASLLLFGAFLSYGVFALISAKKRMRAGILTVEAGPMRNDLIALVVGLLIYAGFALWAHPLLIGVPVFSV